ncbi:hypothetical protein ACFQ0M_10085 [Kitasatospora aburaviensis]
MATLVPAHGAAATLSGGAVVPGRVRLQGAGLAAPGLMPAVTVAGAAAAWSARRPPRPSSWKSPHSAHRTTGRGPGGPRWPSERRVTALPHRSLGRRGHPVRTAFGTSATSVVVTGSGLAGAVELVATDAADTVRWSIPVDPARTDGTTAAADLPSGQPAGPGPARCRTVATTCGSDSPTGRSPTRGRSWWSHC